MSTTLPWTPWHEVVALREDLKSGQLAQHQFAADLYEVVMQAGKRPVYEDPAQFFALTYPTANLRSLVRDVALRLAGQSDKAVHRLDLWYGGGKTHTLITLRHLHAEPGKLPAVASVQEFTQEIGAAPVEARVAALCCDKLDLELGQEVKAPDGQRRTLRKPWSILAWQLAGEAGLACMHAEGKSEERDSPPAENVVTKLLDLAKENRAAVLILLDEVLMYARALADHQANGIGQLRDFLQYLTQAISKDGAACMVVSLLSTKPEDMDAKGKKILQELDTIVARQAEGAIEPVTKNDAAEVLRRRFFTPESLTKADGFKQHVIAALKGIESLDKTIKDNRQSEEERYLRSYPFHPDLTEAFYGKWTQLDGFQKTRGVLRTFAMALREACRWDESPLIGPAVFLSSPGKDELSDAARELAGVASKSVSDHGAANWSTILQAELRIARQEQQETLGLKQRDLEKAVFATFLHSQPVGQTARSRDLYLLLGDARPDKIELEKGLMQWAKVSHWLDDRHISEDGKLPVEWRLGNRPNLNQMHNNARREITDPMLDAFLLAELPKAKSLIHGASVSGVRTHVLPDAPRDIEDDGKFHYAVLGPHCVSESGKPSTLAVRFLRETTSSDRPRVHINSVILLTPSREGLELSRQRLRDMLAWERVQSDLKKEEGVDAARMQTLELKLSNARKEVPAAIRQAWCICVTIGEDGKEHAFKLTIIDDPTFFTLKNDKRSRMQDTAVTAEALLPGGPYNLWREGETFRRVKDLSGAFAQLPHLPKMLKTQAILDTLAEGCAQGIFVLKQIRTDRSERTFWRDRPDESVMKDAGLELVLPQAATLTEIPPSHLSPGVLPGLWDGTVISFGSVLDYFSGEKVVQVGERHMNEFMTVPRAEEAVVRGTVEAAVEAGILWMVSGPASLWDEPVPPGVLQPQAELRLPQMMIAPADIMPANLPEAWTDAQTTAQGIGTALAAEKGILQPWKVVQNVIQAALASNFLELVPGSSEWPCDAASAAQISLRLPTDSHGKGGGETSGQDKAEEGHHGGIQLTLTDAGIQDLADLMPQLIGAAGKANASLAFAVRIDLLQVEGGEAANLQADVQDVLVEGGS